jgi:hypothetical protein
MSQLTICPSCGAKGARVLDTRPSSDRMSIRRRRTCTKCDYRWSTFESEINPHKQRRALDELARGIARLTVLAEQVATLDVRAGYGALRVEKRVDARDKKRAPERPGV